jgi:predicted methyltransferase
MSRRLKRWIFAALLSVAGAAAVVGAGTAPYLPIVHGSTAEEVERMAEWLEVRPGMHVADVGAGDGTYTVELAKRVGPTGHVYATEISKERLAETRQAAMAGLTQGLRTYRRSNRKGRDEASRLGAATRWSAAGLSAPSNLFVFTKLTKFMDFC